MHVELLGAHNCESATTRLASIIVDGTLALDAGGLTSGMSLPAQQDLKAVLLTHQHYDHIRDIPALGMNLYLARTSISVYSVPPVHDVLRSLMNNRLYPNFLERPPGKPTIHLKDVVPGKVEDIGEYRLLAVPVVHSVPAVGYQVTSADGKSLFYAGDTGPGLAECWRQITPQLLIIESTGSDAFENFGRVAGHMTPCLLKEELVTFRRLKGYLPDVIAVHMSPGLEDKIRGELAAVAKELGNSITPGYEGMQVNL